MTRTRRSTREARLAWALMSPALGLLALVAAAPVAVAVWESLHRHDLRLPWLGMPFVGADNYARAALDPQFQSALLHTLAFTATSVSIEIAAGLMLALALDTLTRWRAPARVLVLLPWALPTVVAALIWRFMFDSQAGIVRALPLLDVEWMSHPLRAWVPIVLGDVWKTTPFVALLLLAGLQAVDRTLYEAARLDGANAWHRLVHITLPQLAPALLVAIVFRALDAFRVFDLVFVLTGGGPGTSTDVVSTYAFKTLLQDLRFGYGSAVAVTIFAVSAMGALATARFVGRASRAGRRGKAPR